MENVWTLIAPKLQWIPLKLRTLNKPALPSFLPPSLPHNANVNVSL